MTNLVGLCGSLRHASLNRKLLNEAVKLYRPDEYEEVDISLPLFDEDDWRTSIHPLLLYVPYLAGNAFPLLYEENLNL